MLNRRFQMFGYTDLEREHGRDDLYEGWDPEDRYAKPEENTTCNLCGTPVMHESIDFCEDCKDFDEVQDEESQLAKDEAKWQSRYMADEDKISNQ